MLKTTLRNIAICMCTFYMGFAQEQQNIRGTITDSLSIPIPGVTVKIKGSKTLTISNTKGNYSIRSARNTFLVFKHIGYKTKIVKADRSILNIQLKPLTENLEEVIITSAGIKREKRSLGIATATLYDDDINQGVQYNISNALKGKIAGTIISAASTEPGASSGVIIRGFNSLNNSNQPLYIIDGIPISNPSLFANDINGSFDFGRGIDDVNPNDIASINIIKGASGTVLYGARAANGVIIIDTKKGKSGKLHVDFSSTTTFTDVLRVPNYQNRFGQGYDALHFLGENTSWGPQFNQQELLWGNIVNNTQQFKPFDFQKDQLRNFYETGLEFTNHIAISGGKDGNTGRLSFSNTDINGILPGDHDINKRNTLQASFKTVSDWIDFSGTLNYVATKGKNVPGGEGLSVANNLLQIPTDLDISGFKDLNNLFNNVSNYFTPFNVTNPYYTLENRGVDFNENRFYGAIETRIKLSDKSHLTYRFGIDNTQQTLSTFTAKVDAIPGSPNDLTGTEQDGYYGEANINTQQINHDIILHINHQFKKEVKLQSHIGFNINERKSKVNSISVSTQDIPGFYAISNSSVTPETGGNSILGQQFGGIASAKNELINGNSKNKLIGLFATTTLDYKKQLYLTGNVRNDWYSTLPTKNNSILYGGVNSSWIFSKTFSDITNVINFGKLRVGYGETGVDTAPYQTNIEFVPAQNDNQGFTNLNYPIGNVNAFEVGNRAENLNLKPERRKEFEIGTELYLFKNRINIDFTYFNALTENQILSLPIPASTGFTHQTANIGSISSQGIELLLHINWIKKNNGFNWNSSFNYATTNNILKRLDSRIDKIILGGVDTTTLIAQEGKSIGLIEGSVPKLDPNGNIIVDQNGIPIAAAQKEIYGDTQYDYTLGFNNQFTYKGWGLGFTLDSKQGGLMFSRTAAISRFTGNSIVTTFNDRKPFIVPNSVQESIVNGQIVYVENSTPVNKASQDDYYVAEAFNRQQVIDKSFVKLREVVFSYQFDSPKFKARTHLQKLSFSVIGRNLLLWTPKSNQFIDPETSTFGTDLRSQYGEYSANPSTRSISFNIKAQF